jgi:hypothetical protein
MRNIDPRQGSLLARAAEEAAIRVAKILSLTREMTGLSIRKHNQLIKMLEILASDSFSDGTMTQARVRVICDRMGKSRGQMYRYFKDAETLGIMATKRREGSIGQDISSEREIIWKRVDEILAEHRPGGVAVATSSNETPPSQLRHPRLNLDTPVSIETPNSTDTPDRTDRKIQSGRADQIFKPSIRNLGPAEQRSVRQQTQHSQQETVTVDEVSDLASEIFRVMRYGGDQGHSMWAASAAVKLGLLDEASVATAARLAGEAGKGPGYFRVVLREKSGLSSAELNALFGSVRILPRMPGERPPARSRASPLPTIQRPPAGPSVRSLEAEMNDRRNAMLNLASMN